MHPPPGDGTPFRRIVVGTDGSDSAARAVEHAAALAARTGAELLVAHAYPRRRAHHTEPVRELGASLLRDVVNRHGGRARMRSVLREGEAAGALIEVARDEDAGLIVTGNRGMGGRRISIGTVPSRVAHRSPVSVLIAQTIREMRSGPYQKLMIATDGSPTAERAEAVAAALAERVEAPALLLHVGDPRRGDEVLDRATRRLRGRVKLDAMTLEGDPAGRIVEIAADEGCDLIVVGSRGMTGARRFTGSVPSRVAHRAACHVLIVKTV